MKDIKSTLFKVLSILLICLTIFVLAWMTYVKWLFDNGMEVAWVHKQLASMSVVATLTWIGSWIFRFLNGERKNAFEILQIIVTALFAMTVMKQMISISIAYYGNWWTASWYPL